MIRKSRFTNTSERTEKRHITAKKILLQFYKAQRCIIIRRWSRNIKILQSTHAVNWARWSIDLSKFSRRDRLHLLRHVNFVNLDRMILEMHHAVERNDSTFETRKRTELAWLKDMTAIEMSSQRKFTIKIMKSLVQR